MTRRTVNLPESTDRRIRECALEGESYSATTTRLVEVGIGTATGGKQRPSYVASGEGPGDLGRLAEEYLKKPVIVR